MAEGRGNIDINEEWSDLQEQQTEIEALKGKLIHPIVTD